MDSITRKGIIAFGAIFICIFLYQQLSKDPCQNKISYAKVNLNQGINLDRLYQPVDSMELSNILVAWKHFDPINDSFQIKLAYNVQVDRVLNIVEQYTKGQKHYGAIIFPTNYNPKEKSPLLVWANGLNQSDPSVHLQNSTITNLIKSLPNYFIIIPSFRGQTLVSNQRYYCSDGFFGDAFDGATDDALRLLWLSIKEFDGIDIESISALGVSRGGTVALLMGVRDSIIKNVVSIAAPTDFFSRKVYHRYGHQYKYQFLSTTTNMDRIRTKMLKCSPVYFIKNSSASELLIHGRNDRTVPVSNAQKVVEELKGNENFQSILLNSGHNFYRWDLVFDWLSKNN